MEGTEIHLTVIYACVLAALEDHCAKKMKLRLVWSVYSSKIMIQLYRKN